MRRLLPRSLGPRLTLSYALAFVLFLGLALVSLYLSFGTVLDHRVDEDLEEDIEELALVHARGGDEALAEEIARETEAGDDESVFISVFDSSGEALYASELTSWSGLAHERSAIAAAGGGELGFATVDVPGKGSATRVAYGVIGADRVVAVGESLEERDELMALLPTRFAAVFLLALVSASLLVHVVTRRALRGIAAVDEAARDIRHGTLGRRVRAHGESEEIQHLADTFDAMADRVEALVGGMRDVTDNIAHDLRSPLTRVRAHAESLLLGEPSAETSRRAASDIVAECDRLTRMIDVSLDIAEAEAGVGRVRRRTLDLSAIVESACELFGPLADVARIRLECRIAPGCTVLGIAETLERMLANVLDNAVKFTPAGGRVTLSLAREAGDTLALEIVDEGPGIPRELRERVFERFFRTDGSRGGGGFGLGLSYARAVARLHGGDIALRAPAGGGGGACLAITLPAFHRTIIAR